VEKANVVVTNALFTTEIDFGAGVVRRQRALVEIGSGPGPRRGHIQCCRRDSRSTPVPYALYAKSAGIALPFAGTASSAVDTGLISITQSGEGAAFKAAAVTGVGANLSGEVGLLVVGTTLAINATGNVQVDGQITRDFGTSEFSPAGPIAYGTVGSDGAVDTATANVTSAWVEAEDR
jgi:hypothetical protein